MPTSQALQSRGWQVESTDLCWQLLPWLGQCPFAISKGPVTCFPNRAAENRGKDLSSNNSSTNSRCFRERATPLSPTCMQVISGLLSNSKNTWPKREGEDCYVTCVWLVFLCPYKLLCSKKSVCGQWRWGCGFLFCFLQMVSAASCEKKGTDSLPAFEREVDESGKVFVRNGSLCEFRCSCEACGSPGDCLADKRRCKDAACVAKPSPSPFFWEQILLGRDIPLALPYGHLTRSWCRWLPHRKHLSFFPLSTSNF